MGKRKWVCTCTHTHKYAYIYTYGCISVAAVTQASTTCLGLTLTAHEAPSALHPMHSIPALKAVDLDGGVARILYPKEGS